MFVRYSFISLFGAIVVTTLLFQLQPVQEFVARKVMDRLEKSLGTEMGFGSLYISGMNELTLRDAWILDRQNDTLATAQEARVRFRPLQFFRKNISIRSVTTRGLALNARRDSPENGYNYEFLFSGNQDTTPSAPAWGLDLGRLVMEETRLNLDDKPIGQNISVNLPYLAVQIDDINADSSLLHLQSVQLNQNSVHIFRNPEAIMASAGHPAGDEPGEPVVLSCGQWHIRLDTLMVSGQQLVYQNGSGSVIPQESINFNNLDLQPVNLLLTDLSWHEDNLNARLAHFDLQEQSGFAITQMRGNLTLYRKGAVIDDLYLATGNSIVRDSLALRFRSLTDFSDVLNAVKIIADLKKSEIGMRDVRYFAPDLPNDPEQNLSVNGLVKGTISDLRGKDMEVAFGSHTRFTGDLELIGLPDIAETFIYIGADKLLTNYQELHALLPRVNLPPKIAKLGNVRFQGEFTGFLRDFVAYGTLHTALGILRSDINMKFNPNNGLPAYSGTLKSHNFHIGKWMDQPDLGLIAFNTEIRGSGFELDDLAMDINGTIDHLEYNDYDYHHIAYNGELKKRFFSGLFDMNDRRANFDFKGTIDLSGPEPVFDFNSNITFADLRDLHFTSDKLQIKTYASLHFKGIDPDNLNGELNFTHIAVTTASGHFNVDTIRFTASSDSAGNKFLLRSDFADADFSGEFRLTEIPDALAAYMNKYYLTENYQPPAGLAQNHFDFTLLVKKDHPVTRLIYPGLEHLGGTFIYGHFDGRKQRLTLDGIIPRFTVGDGIQGEQANFLVRTRNDSLIVSASLAGLTIDEETKAKGSRLRAVIADNQARFMVKTGSDYYLNNILLQGNALRHGDTIDVRLDTSQIVLSGREWIINSDNLVRIYNDAIQQAWFNLDNEKQTIKIHTRGSQKNYTSLEAEISNLQMPTLAGIINYNDYDLQGTIQGKIRVLNVFGQRLRVINDLEISDFSIDNQPVGNIILKGGYIPYIRQVNLDAQIIQQDTICTVNGFYTMDPERENIRFDVALKQLPAVMFEPFLAGVMSDMEGTMDGDLKIRGKAGDPDLQGSLRYANGAFRFDYLNTHYSADTIPVVLHQNKLEINPSRLYDANGVPAVLKGSVIMKTVTKPVFDHLTLDTNPDFAMMNLDQEEGEYFYGQAFGKGFIDINGGLNNLDIFVQATTGKNTRVFIPVSYGSEYGDYEFIRFRQPEAGVEPEYRTSLNGMHLDMDLDVTRDAEVQLIFDLQAGDIIRSRGEGNLNLDISTLGDFNMYGNYTIREGDYLFTLKDLINKKFTIEDGGTITWAGDPYEANLDINAIYTVKASGYDLLSDQIDQLSENEIKQLKQPTPMDVYLKLRGALSSPEIAFDIQPSAEEAYRVPGSLTRRLQELRTDENEMNKQVLGLIVFNKFIPAEINTTAVSKEPWRNTGMNTVTEFLSSQMSLYFNDLLSKYDMEVDFQYKNYELGGVGDANNSLTRNELDLELKKKLGRFVVNVGGNLDFGNTSSSVTNTNNLAGDFEVEYSISEDGKLRIKGFRKSDYDIFSNINKNKTGVGFFLRRDFDNARDLFSPDRNGRNQLSDKDLKEDENISNIPD